MASAPHRLGQERATAPPIVLPITSRGMVVTDRLCWQILALAMGLAAGLILWLNRGGTFFFDEIFTFTQAANFDLRSAFEPYNGHLVLVPRAYFALVLEVFGTEYVAFRILHVAAMLLTAALFFALAKRRVGALPALAPTLVLLVFGSAYQHVVIPIGAGVMIAIAAGLGALLAVERGERRTDVVACGLLVLGLATFSIAVPFLVGVAIAVLLRPDRLSRAWIFVVPTALYAAWWLSWAGQPESAGGETTLSNVLLVPSYFADSLAAVLGSLTGLGYDFTDQPPPTVDIGFGRPLAVLAVLGLAVLMWRRRVPVAVWSALGIVVSYWLIGALTVEGFRTPVNVRYLYMGAVAVLLVAAAAASSVRFSRAGIAVLFAVAGVGVVTNIAQMRIGAQWYRDAYSAPTRAEFAMLELAGGNVDPDFIITLGTFASTPAHEYLTAVDRYGSPGFSLAELERQPEGVRERADQSLAEALALRLAPRRSSGTRPDCRTIGAPKDGEIRFSIPSGGATLRARAPRSVPISVGRFASTPSAELGRMSPGETVTLRIPDDSASERWRAAAAGARSIEVCPLR